jgi:RND family efflux transporter MFP subunit
VDAEVVGGPAPEADAALTPGLPDLSAATPRRRRRRSVWPLLLLVGALGGAAYGGWWWWQSRAQVSKVHRALYTARRADLPITITEGGSLKALTSEVIKCEVEGSATIIALVPEGTIITDEDVANKKVLVELDSSELRERLTSQEIVYANAEADFEAAKENFEITKSEGESNIKNGELNVKFGRMDLEHYVGQRLCADALAEKVDLVKLADRLFTKARAERRVIEGEVTKAVAEVEAALAAPPDDKPGPPPRPGEGGTKPERKDDRLATVTQPQDAEVLGGEALQTARGHDAKIELAIERFKRAADELIWTARLEKKGFVSHNELEADQLALKSSLIDLQQELSARELFLRYEFPKKAEEFLSLYRERGKELDRVKARSRAATAQAEAKLKSAEATYEVQKAKYEKLEKQVEKCVIRAAKPGLVVYATTGAHWRSRGEPIEEGTTVRERQEIIKLPDISTLAVETKVHESVVDKVKVGMPANIRIDAFESLRLKGKVHKVAILPDSSSRWMNPDLKQYDTEVSIDGVHANLKPGMSAEVEILVGTVEDALLVPVQAVGTRAGKSVVYVVTRGVEQEREVELGESNERFVAVLSGMEAGEKILLEAPQALAAEDDKDEKAKEGEEDDEEAPAGPRPPSPGGEGRNAGEARPKGGRPEGGMRGKGKGRPSGRPGAGGDRTKGARKRPSGEGARPEAK